MRTAIAVRTSGSPPGVFTHLFLPPSLASPRNSFMTAFRHLDPWVGPPEIDLWRLKKMGVVIRVRKPLTNSEGTWMKMVGAPLRWCSEKVFRKVKKHDMILAILRVCDPFLGMVISLDQKSIVNRDLQWSGIQKSLFESRGWDSSACHGNPRFLHF